MNAAQAALDTSAEVVHLVVRYSVAGILAIACGQVALLAVWRLTSLMAGRAIFTRPALRWVDVITLSGALGLVLVAVVMVHLLLFARVGGPAVFFTLVACLVACPAFAILMRVMRGLLVGMITSSGPTVIT